jgi:outer membrane protein assembly factor BamB
MVLTTGSTIVPGQSSTDDRKQIKLKQGKLTHTASHQENLVTFRTMQNRVAQFVCIACLGLLYVAIPTCILAQISAGESVLTQHNDPQRTGVYGHEIRLTPARVANTNAVAFGERFERLYIRKVDAQVAAQPLYAKAVVIGGKPRNVLYVVTRKNTIYAFDADNTDQSDPRNGIIWQNPVTLKFIEPVTNQTLFAERLREVHTCGQTLGPVGVTSTPVIDAQTHTMYLVARFGHGLVTGLPAKPDRLFGANVYHILVAIDITTGQETRRTVISAPDFSGFAELNRPGLLLMNGVIYVGFGTPVCDVTEKGERSPSHGFVIAYNASDLRQLAVFNTSTGNSLAGIWQSGAGLAGNQVTNTVFALTGNNGSSDNLNGRIPLGESILKLRLAGGTFCLPPNTTGPCRVDHFTAGNWYRLDIGSRGPGQNSSPNPVTARRPQADQNIYTACIGTYKRLHPQDSPTIAEKACEFGGDSDLASGGPVILANGWVLGGGKQGRIYTLDPNDMAHAKQAFQASYNTWHQAQGRPKCSMQDPRTDLDGCFVSPDDYDFAQAWGPNIHGAPVVWQRSAVDFGFLYLMAEKDYLRAYRIYKNSRIDETAAMTLEGAGVSDGRLASLFPHGLRSPDGMPGGAVSLSSNGDQTGIVWVSIAPQDATYAIVPGVLMAFDALTLRLLWNDPDSKISFAKFVPPTIAGGKVFRATFGDGYSDPRCDPSQKNPNDQCGSIVVYGVKRFVPPRPKF